MRRAARLPLVLIIAALASGAQAAAPFAGDPTGWWSAPQTIPPLPTDPLELRSANAEQATISFDNGVDPVLYRLWGLQPLQSQLLRKNEIILELWTHPSGSARQAVVRLTLRSDGREFVQARAGLACCKAAIDRRVDIDAEVSPTAGDALRALAADPLWSAPRLVTESHSTSGDTVGGLCAGGTGYDLTQLANGQARVLHRACEDAQIGQLAPALELALSVALGRDPRFDAVFAKGADFSAERAAYQALIDGGGALTAALN